MSGHSNAPTKSDVVQKLQSLICGQLSRDEASNWADAWITRLDEIDDLQVCRAIDRLCGADAPSTDRPYLYNQSDFERWLSDLTENQ